ncbi:MAG TPA: alpha/beta hydrolase [Desulfobacteraceae bacterium]|nr:alpha/beta hydrolase [Desulfobacteraceae bacterium]
MRLRRLLTILLFVFFLTPLHTQADTAAYGSNPEAGQYAELNGIKMYYEIYGSGAPVLVIHGNGQSIADMQFQIAHFAKTNKVIVADTRGHGKSELGTDHLNYIQMMGDYNALLDQLGVTGANIIGWSDGGILALLLAIHHPDKVNKVATMGANLRPDESAVDPAIGEVLQPISEMIDEMIASKDTSDNWQFQRQLFDLLMTQPDIPIESVQKIEAPVLIIAGDKDIIRARHSLEIFENLPKAHLAILPGQTHWAPITDPEGFNALVEKFFDTAYTRPTSLEILKHELGE